MHRRIALTALFCLALLQATACGMKQLPEPVDSEDAFGLEVTKSRRVEGCLSITAVASGAYANIDELSLLLEPLGDGEGQGCFTCPFTPRRMVRLDRSQGSSVTRNGPVIEISHCGLDPATAYRWRLAATNAFPELGAVLTPVRLAEP